MNPYLSIFLFFLAAVGLVGVIVLLNSLLGPRTVETAVKLEPFECGSRPLQTRNTRPLSIKYYPVAIIFLLFDLETVLLFIWSMSCGNREMTTLSFVSFIFFFGVLGLTFVYLWKDGGLEWR